MDQQTVDRRTDKASYTVASPQLKPPFIMSLVQQFILYKTLNYPNKKLWFVYKINLYYIDNIYIFNAFFTTSFYLFKPNFEKPLNLIGS